MGYVLTGRLRVNIGFEEFTLGPGDAITFDSAAPHRLSNDGDERVTAVWFVQGRRTADGARNGEDASATQVRRG